MIITINAKDTIQKAMSFGVKMGRIEDWAKRHAHIKKQNVALVRNILGGVDIKPSYVEPIMSMNHLAAIPYQEKDDWELGELRVYPRPEKDV